MSLPLETHTILPLIDTVVMICFGTVSACAGYAISRHGKVVSERAAFLLVIPAILIAASMYFEGSGYFAPLVMLVAGRGKFILLTLTVPAIVFALYRHASRWVGRAILILLLTVSTLHFSIRPFLLPAFANVELGNLKTVMYDGVCLQGTDYTCGPAASVTALRMLGIRAEEGELAIAAGSTPLSGTPTDQLMLAINKCYGNDGVSSTFQRFDSIDQLRGKGLTIVPIKLSRFKGHYQTVLEVTDDYIKVADPECGWLMMTHKVFEKRWKYSGIVLERHV